MEANVTKVLTAVGNHKDERKKKYAERSLDQTISEQYRIVTK